MANEKNLYYGATDVDLTDTGAEELKDFVKSCKYPDISGAVVYTSGMKRTDRTLEIIYPGTEHLSEPLLAEMNFGNFEMRAYEELQYDEEYQTWITGDYLKNVCPGGESAEQHVNRVINGFKTVFKATTGDVLIVCHDGTISAIMTYLFPDEGENRWYWRSRNGGGYGVVFDGDKPIRHYKIP